MRAKIRAGGQHFILALEPETDEERALLKRLGVDLSRPHLINSRGFEYLAETVEFYVQLQPRGD